MHFDVCREVFGECRTVEDMEARRGAFVEALAERRIAVDHHGELGMSQGRPSITGWAFRYLDEPGESKSPLDFRPLPR